MITLDAGVLIALYERDDSHHQRATSLLTELSADLLYLSPITHAEILVRSAQAGREEARYIELERLGTTVLNLPPDAGVWLAQLRARTGLKLPDCSVILTAQQSDSKIATFDARLAQAARELGIDVLS